MTTKALEYPLRVEDRRFLTGAGRYVADVRLERCLDAAFVRAGTGHGVLRHVDTGRARGLPGIEGAWSARDLPTLPAVPSSEGETDRVWPALAVERVRYAGEPVAVVVASDRYAAEDGAAAIEIELEPLQAMIDPTEAAESTDGIFPGRSNVVRTTTLGNAVPARIWQEAAIVVEGAYNSQLLAPSPMEARAFLAAPERGGGLTAWCSHQAAHRLRDLLAEALGMREEAVRVIVPDVGGAFGHKSQIYPEYVVVAHLARMLDRPVRWIEDRRESLVAALPGRGQNQRVRIASDADGRILAIDAELDLAVGAYPHVGEGIATNTGQMICGAYRIPHAQARLRAVTTNGAPTAAYRGAGRPEAAFAVERVVDRLARALDMDPADLRRANFVRDFPHTTATGWVYDSGDYERALDRALALAGYDSLRAEQQKRRASAGTRPLGIGICCYVERAGGDIGSTEYGSVEALTDGTFVARSGCCPSGQAHETTFSALVAAALGVDPARVRLIEGDTAEVPSGEGTYGSRSLQVGGSVLHRASEGLIAKASSRAAEAWEVPAESVAYDGAVFRAGTRTTTFATLAEQGPLVCEGEFSSPQSFPFGCYVAAVEIDPELGSVHVLRLVGVDDVGVIFNASVVEGQIRGSIVQGLGQALYEEVVHDAAGVPQAESLLDYLMPTVSELPEELILDKTVTPNPNTPLGTKGAGEVGCIGVPPAVVNAVADALRLDDESVLRMPLTPETVWRAIRSMNPSPKEAA